MSQRTEAVWRSLASLEAGALLGKGIDVNAESRPEEAKIYLLAAERLAPRNPLIAWSLSQVFLRQPADGEAALPRLRVAVTAHTSRLREMAQKKLEAVEYWLKLHPPQGNPSRP